MFSNTQLWMNALARCKHAVWMQNSGTCQATVNCRNNGKSVSLRNEGKLVSTIGPVMLRIVQGRAV